MATNYFRSEAEEDVDTIYGKNRGMPDSETERKIRRKQKRRQGAASALFGEANDANAKQVEIAR
jgi:hypothetical protein